MRFFATLFDEEAELLLFPSPLLIIGCWECVDANLNEILAPLFPLPISLIDCYLCLFTTFASLARYLRLFLSPRSLTMMMFIVG
jgi:hypothetical protein